MVDGDAPVPRRRDLRNAQDATGPIPRPEPAARPASEPPTATGGDLPVVPTSTGDAPTRSDDVPVPTSGGLPVVPAVTGPVPSVPTTTGSTPALGRPPVPVEHRRRWIVVTLVAVGLAVAAVTGGPWLYSRFMVAPPAPLELTTPSQVPSNDPNVPLALAGTWSVADGSQAGYRIGEVLNGTSVEVVGRTDEVSGTVTIEGNALTATSVVVTTSSITTDASARDAYFRRALDTTTFPEASFTAATSVDLGDLSTATTPISVEVPGSLTIRDRTIDVTATLQVQRTVGGLQAVGQIAVALADLGITPLDRGFLSVSDSGSVEFLLDLTR